LPRRGKRGGIINTCFLADLLFVSSTGDFNDGCHAMEIIHGQMPEELLSKTMPRLLLYIAISSMQWAKLYLPMKLALVLEWF
jgi:hypothetical protein